MAPRGKYGAERIRMKADSATFCGPIWWLMSAIFTWGARPQITPFITPTLPSLRPKSVSRVTKFEGCIKDKDAFARYTGRAPGFGNSTCLILYLEYALYLLSGSYRGKSRIWG